MKLRNKKTGEIVEYDSIGFRKGLSDGWEDFIAKAKSLAELNATWEDYSPKELIKDEKIRKAIMAWANIQGQPITKVLVDCYKDSHDFFNYRLFGYTEEIMPNGEIVTNENSIAIYFEFISLEKIEFDFKHGYTIAELCGEEEE